MLQRMRIYSNNANGCCPFMVNLVNKAVKARMMEQSIEQMKGEILYLHIIFQSSFAWPYISGIFTCHNDVISYVHANYRRGSRILKWGVNFCNRAA